MPLFGAGRRARSSTHEQPNKLCACAYRARRPGRPNRGPQASDRERSAASAGARTRLLRLAPWSVHHQWAVAVLWPLLLPPRVCFSREVCCLSPPSPLPPPQASDRPPSNSIIPQPGQLQPWRTARARPRPLPLAAARRRRCRRARCASKCHVFGLGSVGRCAGYIMAGEVRACIVATFARPAAKGAHSHAVQHPPLDLCWPFRCPHGRWARAFERSGAVGRQEHRPGSVGRLGG